MTKRPLRRYGLGLLVAVTFTGLLAARIWSNSASEGAGQPRLSRPQPVQTVVVSSSLYTEEVISTGTLRAFESIDLQVEVAGKLIHIGFSEGSLIHEGTLLLKVDDAELQAELVRIERRRDHAKLLERRLAPLVTGGGISASEYDEAVSQLSILEAEIELTRKQIERRSVHAPFEGVVGLRFVSEGAYVTPSTRIASFQSLARMKLEFSLAEKHGSQLTPGQSVEFTVAGRDEIFEAIIYAVEPQIEVTTRTLLVRAEVDNRSGGLRPGAFARVKWIADRDDSAVFIPAVAVVPGLDEDTVFVVEDGKVKSRTVIIGPRSSERVRILSGLSVGEEVVITGAQQVRPGSAVSILTN